MSARHGYTEHERAALVYRGPRPHRRVGRVVSKIVALAVATVLTVAYVLTEHPLLFATPVVAAVVLAWVGLRDEPDRVELAPRSPYDRLDR